MGLLEDAHSAYLKWKKSNSEQSFSQKQDQQQEETRSNVSKAQESNPYLILH